MRIRVLHKPSGQTGTVEDYEFDPTIYQRLGEQATQPTAEPQPQSLTKRIGAGAKNIVGSLAAPFARTGENIFDATTLGLQSLGAAGLSKVDPQAGARLASKNIAGQRRTEQKTKDPEQLLRQQLADSLNIAAWVVPFGKARAGAGLIERGLTKSVLPGAGVGALTSPETAKALMGEEFSEEDIIGSAVLGGGTAGALHLGGKLLSKVTGRGAVKAGGKLREGVVGRTPRSLKEASRLKAQNIIQKLDDLGAPKGSAQAKLDWAVGKYDDLIVQYNDELLKIGKPVNTTGVISKAKEGSKLIVDDITKGAGGSNVNKWTIRLKNIKTWEELSKLKFELLDEASGKTVRAQIAREFHKHVDSLLKTNKSLAPILKDMSTLHTAVGGQTKARGGGLLFTAGRPNIGVPMTSVKIPGTRQAIQAVQDIAGTGLSKTGAVTGRISDIAAPVSARIPTGLPSQAAIRKVTESARALPDLEEISPQTQEGLMDVNGELPSLGDTLTGFTPQELYQGYQSAISAGDTASAKQLKSFYNDEVEYQQSAGGGLNVTKVTAQNYSNAESGLSSLDSVYNLIFEPNGSLNKSAIVATKAPGAPSQEARQLKAHLYNVADSYLRLRTGAQANPTEIQKLADSLEPGVFDNAETIEEKLGIYDTTFRQIVGLAGNKSLAEPELPELVELTAQ